MPIEKLPNGITEVRYKDGTLVMMLLTQIMDDLNYVAVADSIEQAKDEKWLLGEVRHAGQPDLTSRDEDGNLIKCWNCGGTKGFYAPTGPRNGSLWHSRTDVKGGPSPIRREWQLYDCPACQNPTARLRDGLDRAGIIDPALVMMRADDIRWDYPGREEMGEGVKRFIQRMRIGELGGLLVLAGPFESGKTSLVEHIVYECVKANRNVLYITAEAFKRAIKEQMWREDEGGSPFFERIRTVPVLVLDQLDWIREETSSGKESYTAEVARDVLDFRYAQRRTHSTVVTINLEDWEAQGGKVLAAIYNRLLEGEVYTSNAQKMREELPVRVYGQATGDKELV